MENETLIVEAIESLAYPVLIVNESDKTYIPSYMNESMKILVNSENPIQKPLLSMIKEYALREDKKPYIFDEVDIFDGVYTIHFSYTKEGMFILFMHIQLEQIFEHLTFNEVTKSCSAIMVILSKEGNIVDANQCFCNFVGLKKEEVVSMSFFNNFIPGNLQQLQSYFEKIMLKDSFHQQFVTPLKGHDDIYRISWQVSKLHKHNSPYIVAIGSDITKLIKENSTLKHQLKSIKLGFEYFPFSIAYMNSKGFFTTMNARFMKIFGIAELELPFHFDKIELFKEKIGFVNMQKSLHTLREVHYILHHTIAGKNVKLKVDIRMLRGKKESSKFYIVVVQKLAK